MGWRFRKTFRTGPVRWNWTKRGIGYSWGLPCFRFGVNAVGQKYISFSIPLTGLYFIKYLDKANNPAVTNNPAGSNNVPITQTLPVTPPTSNTPWWKNP